MIIQYDPLWNIKLIEDVNFVLKEGEVCLKLVFRLAILDSQVAKVLGLNGNTDLTH